MALLSLKSQLSALRAALGKTKEWMESSIEEIHHQLVLDLGTSITCCEILASRVYGLLTNLQKTSNGKLATVAKARFVFKSSEMTGLQKMIDRQTSTLKLLLTACNSKTLAEQQKFLRKSSIRNSMKRVQKDTASLIDQPDSVSVLTSDSGMSSRLSRLFDFDSELLASQPYSWVIWRTRKLSFLSQDQQAYQRTSNIDVETIGVREIPELNRENIIQDVKWKSGRRKVLLLGVGEASKTTFLKQMQHIYPNDALTVDRKAWRCIILDNLVSTFQIFLDVLKTHDYDLANFISRSNSTGYEDIHDQLPLGSPNMFRALLAKEAVQCEMRNEIHTLPEQLNYLLLHLDRLCAEDFVPTDEDILHARVRTTGISNNTFQVRDHAYIVYDVGGERSEGKKWIKVFDDVSLVLFFVPMSGYDEPLYEDMNENKMHEALTVFQNLGHCTHFKDTTIVICFTRMDVFKRKISSGMSPITGRWDFDGVSTDVAAAQVYFTKKFEDLVPHRHPLHIRYLDATNTQDVRTVLADVFSESNSKSPSGH